MILPRCLITPYRETASKEHPAQPRKSIRRYIRPLCQLGATASKHRVPRFRKVASTLPVSASLAQVWLALRDSLEDIRQRAAGGAGDPGGQDKEQEGGPEKGRPAA